MLYILLGCEPGSFTLNDKVSLRRDTEIVFSDTLYGIPNIDDDDQNGQRDWDDNLAQTDPSLEDDLTTLLFPSSVLSQLRKNQEFRIRLLSDNIRIYRDGELKLNSDGDNVRVDVFNDENDIKYHIEWPDYLASGELEVVWIENKNSGQEELFVWPIQLQAAPLLINHHLQPAEQAYAMEYRGSGGNMDFINGFADVLAEQFTSYSVNQYGFDVWIQDEIEFGYLTHPEARIDVVIDSIRDRELDELPEEELEGPNMMVETWGQGWATSQDSFGNLEATPPITVDGTHYPFGRIYYGRWNSEGVNQELRSFLDSQSVQNPLEMDITFLCVGHVDEYISFVPDPTARQGFRMLITDTEVGYELLESAPATNPP